MALLIGIDRGMGLERAAVGFCSAGDVRELAVGEDYLAATERGTGRRGFVEFATGRAKNPRGSPTFEPRPR